jgi:hypothetical protein
MNTEFAEVIPEIARQDLIYKFTKCANQLALECLIPPYSNHSLSLLTELWLLIPLDFECASDVIKLFNREIQSGTAV